MKGLKDFRRSLNKDRTSGGRPGASAPPTFTGVKNAVSIQPPKKVIRATRDYRSRAPQELSFHKGDFFHVLSDEAGNPDWLEATNPITNARGLVPAAYFDVLTNNRPPGAGGGGGSALSSPTLGAPPAGSMGARSGATSPAVTAKGGGGMYAIVKYDFAAERADELEAKAGESIIVIAQSNFEWFVAKPIGRLGGPGLIPVAFVEIKDLTTGRVVENVQELIESGAVPKVEEWKKMTADYKKNTIPLGRFDFQGAAPVNDSPYGQPAPDPPSKDSGYGQTQHSDQLLYQQQQEHQQMMAQQQQMQQQQQQQGQPELPPGMPPGEPLPAGIVTSATVDSFHYEQGDYWFRIQAAHVAGPSSSAPTSVPRAPAGEERDLILYRLYEDFYEFQIALLDHFPAEAGREVDANGQPSERILPLMPGPLDTVDDVITSQRRYDLDAYIVELCALPQYILRSELVRLFFEPRPGDHCTTHPLSQQAQAAAAAAARQKVDANQLGQEYDYLSSHVADEARPPVPPSNGTSKYAEDQPVGPRSSVDDMARSVGRLSMGAGRSSGGGQRNSGQSGTDSRSSGAARSAGGGAASHLQPHGSMSRKHSGTTVDSQGSGTSAHAQQAPPAPQAGAPPFIKIKIFHRANDDLVAIRVPPNVTHAALLEKVRERLGSDLAILRYREQAPEPGASGLMRLSDDEDLREWLASGAKLVLYADVR